MKKSRVIMNVPAKTTGSGPNLPTILTGRPLTLSSPSNAPASTIVLSFPAANHRVVFGVGAHTPAPARLSRTPRKRQGICVAANPDLGRPYDPRGDYRDKWRIERLAAAVRTKLKFD